MKTKQIIVVLRRNDNRLRDAGSDYFIERLTNTVSVSVSCETRRAGDAISEKDADTLASSRNVTVHVFAPRT